MTAVAMTPSIGVSWDVGGPKRCSSEGDFGDRAGLFGFFDFNCFGVTSPAGTAGDCPETFCFFDGGGLAELEDDEALLKPAGRWK